MSAQVAMNERTISASARKCGELGSSITKELPEMLNALPSSRQAKNWGRVTIDRNHSGVR
jgi:hypothetical protein